MLAKLTRACCRRIKTRHRIWTVPSLIKIANSGPVEKHTHGSQSLPEKVGKSAQPGSKLLTTRRWKGGVEESHGRACWVFVGGGYRAFLAAKKTAGGQALRILEISRKQGTREMKSIGSAQMPVAARSEPVLPTARKGGF